MLRTAVAWRSSNWGQLVSNDVLRSSRTAIRNFSASASRSKQRLVILGSGWGGYEVLRGVDKKRWSECIAFVTGAVELSLACNLDVTVLSPNNYFNFTPLLASCAVGTLELRCAVEPVSKHVNRFYCTSQLLTSFNPQVSRYCPQVVGMLHSNIM